MEITLANPSQMKKAAADVLKKLLKGKKRPLVLALQGELGSGKTTFVQNIARLLGVQEQITSPTFLLLRTLKLPRKKRGISQLVHLDGYRVASAKELLGLGLKEILKQKSNLVVIEWPEKIRRYLPEQTLFLNFKITGPKKRQITINND